MGCVCLAAAQVREHAQLAEELAEAREHTKKENDKYEVLQSECAMLTRDFLANTMKLEAEVDRLRTQEALRLEHLG